MNTEPHTLGAGSFTAKVRCREERQTEINGSCLVVQPSVVFPTCVKYISRQGVIGSLKSLCCPGFVLRVVRV